MKEKNKLSPYKKAVNASWLPYDVHTKCAYIKMCSNREVVVEDAGKLVNYTDECVKVVQQKQVINIRGKDLKIICLANNDIRVTGFIISVSFE